MPPLSYDYNAARLLFVICCQLRAAAAAAAHVILKPALQLPRPVNTSKSVLTCGLFRSVTLTLCQRSAKARWQHRPLANNECYFSIQVYDKQCTLKTKFFRLMHKGFGYYICSDMFQYLKEHSMHS